MRRLNQNVETGEKALNRNVEDAVSLGPSLETGENEEGDRRA